MVKSFGVGKGRWLRVGLVLGVTCLIAVPALAGPYRDSAHGNAGYGVNRSTLEVKYAAFATGNCAHCHETHAGLGGANPHTLFSPSFDPESTHPYQRSANFCFSCHDGSDLRWRNQDYSATFGGAVNGPQSILEAFNQESYHNLTGIWNFLSTSPTYSTWFAKLGNPCSACHNSHLARRNWVVQPGYPPPSAISRPGDHNRLWGETELMPSAYYEPPFADPLSATREPAGVGEQVGTPDYVGFCTTCHTPDAAIPSTTHPLVDLKKIDWAITGLNPDKHGGLGRDGAVYLREPYAAAGVKTNFVLACTDCHESHGSANLALLRRQINGEYLEGPITTASPETMGYACKRCHTDDLAATGSPAGANRWAYVHHDAAGAPYAKSSCLDCHASGDGSTPIACGNCHGHGMDDSWAGTWKTGRKTF